MINNQTVLCLMLARGGSKGVPNKNIKLLNDKPLIYYTIQSVKEAKIFDKFILSTDSSEIGDIAINYGVEVPFLRPDKLSSDNSLFYDAIIHALKWVEKNDKKYDLVQYVYPTTPLKIKDDYLNGLQLFQEKNADMVISVCEDHHTPFWSNSLPENNSLRDFIPTKYHKNRQDLPRTYRINGCIFIAKWDVFYEKKDWFKQNTYAYIMPEERSVDIDTPFDFELAELYLKRKLKK